MAGEIVELSRTPLRKGCVAYQLLCLYPVDPLIMLDGVLYKPCRRQDLPAGVETYGLLTQDELTAIDTGSLYFEQLVLEKGPFETLESVLEKARKLYPKGFIHLDEFRYRIYKAGRRHDAVAAVVKDVRL